MPKPGLPLFREDQNAELGERHYRKPVESVGVFCGICDGDRVIERARERDRRIVCRTCTDLSDSLS